MPSVLELAVFGLELKCGECGRTVPYERFSLSHGICYDCRNAWRREQRKRKKGERNDD